MAFAIVILAAGQGKRMASNLPKVLHPVGGRPMLAHVLDTARSLAPDCCAVVYGHGGEAVLAAFAEATDITWIEQAERLGTGHAVAQALPSLPHAGAILVLYGDAPLIRRATLSALVEHAEQGRLAILTAERADPRGYGRIVRDTNGRVLRIVEEKDASSSELDIREINTGILALSAERLRAWVGKLHNHNAQGEYYLTDVIAMAVADGVPVEALIAPDPREAQGVNDRVQLAALERYYQRRQAEVLMLAGATLLDPARLDVRGTVTTGKDVVIDANVIFEGEVVLGERVRIGPHTLIRDSVIGDDCEILSHCVIEEATIADKVQIGPFARLRPGVQMADRSKIGNFVEAKKTVIGEGSKVNHLTYIGDAEIGHGVNVGAGTITCNYDGANKHKTVIEDNVFIGSNTALVAPIRVGANATVGAGSTVSRDVPPDTLVLTRAPIKQIAGWKRPKKKHS